MISSLRPTVGRAFTEPFVRLLARAKINPNLLTVLGLGFNGVTGWVLATEHLWVGGILVLFSAWFDMLDGALARLLHRTSRFGALLDSTVDRLSEAAVFLGLILFYANRGDTFELSLTYAAIIGSLMVSYARARAEGLGLKGEIGVFARPERIVLLALGLFLTEVSLTALVVVLWVLAVGAHLTAFHRLFFVWQQSRKDRS